MKLDPQAITWGLLLILWGITALFDFVPAGVGIAGTGLILLGLNAARYLSDIPTKGGTTILGILALVWGGLDLARQILHLPFASSGQATLAISLIVLGGILLARQLLRMSRPGVENLS